MAHAQSSVKNENADAAGENEIEVKPTTFHDFLGNKGQSQESAAPAVEDGCPPPEVSPSSTSDLGSGKKKRNAGNHLAGIPYYGSRGDITLTESSNRFTGYKRSNSDSFMMSSRDKFPHGLTDSQDNPLLTKLLRYSGGEHPRRTRDEETAYNMHKMRPISASFISQSSTGGRTDNNPSKWSPDLYCNILRVVVNVGTPLVSQTAADEGSRTGIKGSGVLSSAISASGNVSGRQPAGVLIRSGGKQKSGITISELESSSQRGTEAGGRQMTIFYGGQAHVFDNVHPNKADVIMALAGSNGGSWSTTYKPNSAVKPYTGDNDATRQSTLRELHARPSDK
ncbi:hypothetical protein OROGR_027065 [Orobanche gracilis]